MLYNVYNQIQRENDVEGDVMSKRKLIPGIMVLLGGVSFLVGILMSIKELMEYGLCIGVAGIIIYTIMFVMHSTTPEGRKTIFD